MRKTNDIKHARRLARLNTLTAILLAFATLVVANTFSSLLYAYWTYDRTASGRLSPHSRDFLQRSQGEVRMTALFEHTHPFNRGVRHLLKAYTEAAALVPGLTIETTAIDVNHDLAAATELLRTFSTDVNVILIEYGGQHRIVGQDDMILTNTDGSWADQTPDTHSPLHVNAELACTSALIELLTPTRSTVCFVQGHGEYDPEDHHPITGASAAAQTLAINGLIIKKINLHENGAVPDTCDVLVIAGPRTSFSRQERESVAAYLDNGGKALILVDDVQAGGLGPVIEHWGLRISPPEPGERYGKPISTRLYADHPVTRRLQNVTTFFANPCVVDRVIAVQTGVERADKPLTTPLILAAPAGRRTEDTGNSMLRPIAAVAELGGARLTGRRYNTRLIVCGDSTFISNAMNQEGYNGNKTFLLAAIEWLAGRQPLGAAPDDALPLLASGIDPHSGWQELSVMTGLALPAAILIFGLLIFRPATDLF